MKENRVNEEKDRNTQRRETEMVTGREKVGEEAIRKMGTKGETAIKPKPVETLKKESDKQTLIRRVT